MSEPAKLTDADVEQILADASDEVPAEDASFVDLVEGAGRWLKDKMENEPEALPPTFMVKLYLDGKKAIKARDVVPDVTEEDKVSILDRIDALPREHAVALIKGELARLDSLRADYFAALERISEGD